MNIDNLLLNKLVPITNASFKTDKTDCSNVHVPTLFDPFGNPVNFDKSSQAIDYYVPLNKVEYLSSLAYGNCISVFHKVKSTSNANVILSFESNYSGTGAILSNTQYLYVNGILKPSIATGAYKEVSGKLTMNASWSFLPTASDVGAVWCIMFKNAIGPLSHVVMELRC
jgi:hypothetical protein